VRADLGPVPASARAATCLGLLAVFASQFAHVSPANFGGADEWLIVHLTSRGILGVPYAHRPLVFLWTVPAARLWPHDLWAYYAVHAAWLFLAGWLTYLLARRLLPGWPMLWLVAGTAALVWAPEDFTRLNCVLLAGYSGFTFGALAAVLLFVESWFQRSRAMLALAAVLALPTGLGFEGTIPLMAGAPLLLLCLDRERSRRLWLWVGAWWLLLAGLSARVAWIFLAGRSEGSYQASGLGFDPHPWRVLARIGGQFGYHLLPLLQVSPGELRPWPVAVSGVVFLAAFVTVLRLTRAPAPDAGGRRTLAVAAGLGVLLAALGYSLLMLSPSILRAARTQFLSGPGIALLLAAAAGLLASVLPAAARQPATAALGAWIVVVGGGRTLAMQREWDERLGFHPVQQASLEGLTRQAPRLAPHTFVILLDGVTTWPASFTYRHALAYLYEERARGQVWGAHDFLYPMHLLPEGVVSAPWPVLASGWGESPSLYRYDELIVARDHGQGRVEVLARWPEEVLGPLPAGASYAPQARIETGPPPPAQSILRLRSRPPAGPPSPVP
jgi:hypothetical protein